MGKASDLLNKSYDAANVPFNAFLDLLKTYPSTGTAVTSATSVDPRFLKLENYKLGKLGTPYMGWCILSTMSFQNVVKNNLVTIDKKAVKSDDGISVLLQHILFNVNRTFNIVETAVKGFNGTVKEFSSAGDYTVSLTGKFVGAYSYFTDTYGLENFIFVIQDYIDRQKSITLINPELMILYGNLTSFIITDFSINQNEQYTNIRDFTLTLKSDNDLNIIEVL